MNVTPEQAPGAAENTRLTGYAHRVAIAKRFGQRINSKDAVFMSGAAANLDMPQTISNGAAKPITGFNRWMLLQVMSDRGWKDPRFFTQQQIQSEGWELKSGAQPVILQFVKTIDASGASLTQPEVQRFAVYNAEFLHGLEPAIPRTKLPAKALALAMAQADFEPGEDLGNALAQWVTEQYNGLNVHNEAGHHALVQAMTVSAVFSSIEFQSEKQASLQKLQKHWGSEAWASVTQNLIAQDPSMFFDAVRVAEQISGHIVSIAQLANMELPLDQSMDKKKGKAEMEAPTKVSAESNAAFSTYKVRLEEMFANRQAVLAVPFSEKDRVKALGGVWHGDQGIWFVPEGADVSKFSEWDPRKHHLGKTASDDVIVAEFEKELVAMGLMLGNKGVIPDGKWHNVRVDSKKGKNSAGAYLLNLTTSMGQINNKHSGESRTWRYNGPLLTPEQRASMRARAVLMAKAADEAQAKAQNLAAVHAQEILAKAIPAHGHAYAQKKGMNPSELLQVPGSVLRDYEEFYGESKKSAIKSDMHYLVIPMQDALGNVRAVQAIGSDGSKSFMRGGQKKGTMFVFGAPSLQSLCEKIEKSPSQFFPASFVEGFATGASLHAGTNQPVVICWDAGNLETVVARAAADLPKNMVPILAVDNDQFYVERALGFLSSRLGVNPSSDRGSTVEILSGQQSTRVVSLGDAIADGEWHQAPNGRYRIDLTRATDSTEITAIKVEALVSGDEKAMTIHFCNRGVEAGIAGMKSLQELGKPDMLALTLIPDFQALHYRDRPTDWNDLHKLGGLQAVNAQFNDCLYRAGLFKEPERQPHEQSSQRQAPAQSSGVER